MDLQRRVANNASKFFWISTVFLSVLVLGGLIWFDVRPAPTLCDFAAEGDLDGVRRLLDEGAEPDACASKDGLTPLASAALAGRPEAVNLLLKVGADPNAVSEDGRTALHCAVEGGDLTSVVRLLDAGADPYLKDADGDSSLIVAIRESHAAVSLFLEAAEGLELGRTWHEGAGSGCMPLLEWSIEHGIDVDVLSSRGLTALLLAANAGHLEAVRLLVDAGANLDVRDARERSALHHAAVNGDLPLVRFLVDAGASLEARDCRGLTPLMSASENGQLEAVKELVELGADIDALDNEEHTLELVAGGVQGREVVRYLQEYRAKIRQSGEDVRAFF